MASFIMAVSDGQRSITQTAAGLPEKGRFVNASTVYCLMALTGAVMRRTGGAQVGKQAAFKRSLFLENRGIDEQLLFVTVIVKQCKLYLERRRSFDSGSASAQDDGTPLIVILSAAKDLDIVGSGISDLYRLSFELSRFIHGGAACRMGDSVPEQSWGRVQLRWKSFGFL